MFDSVQTDAVRACMIQLLNSKSSGVISMNIINRIGGLTATLAFATLLGCASTSSQESTGAYVDDTVITTKAKAALFNAPTLKSTEIGVETYKGVVQLSGFVGSQEQINTAVDLTRKVGGVVSVKNDMRLK
jgi:osmotically-inducible protein OsmY